MANISQAAIDLIVEYEVSSKSMYEKKYQKPEWPGVQSGLTIGIGYDVGYATKKQLWNDWEGKIPNDMIALLEQAVGQTGPAGKAITHKLRKDITVPWDAAMSVYTCTVIPRWIKTLEKSLPNTDKLSDDSRGALVSLIYNRGASFNMKGDRYKEMRNIKAHMQAEQFEKIPGEIRAMKRIWVGTEAENGLARRREAEAKLFEKGLKKKLANTAAGVILTAGAVTGAAVGSQQADAPIMSTVTVWDQILHYGMYASLGILGSVVLVIIGATVYELARLRKAK